MKKGIIFDMDGTLWDSAENVAAAWNLAVKRSGYKRDAITKEDMYRVMGKTMDVIADILFPDWDDKERESLLESCCGLENEYLREHGGILYPGIRGTLEKLKPDYHLYIVSNCQAGYIEAFLDYYRLNDLIEDKQCYGDNGRPKADNIRILCERNKLDLAVYVGDIQGDYDASKEAGVRFIHATYGFGTIAEPVPKIAAFTELPEAVKQVFGAEADS